VFARERQPFDGFRAARTGKTPPDVAWSMLRTRVVPTHSTAVIGPAPQDLVTFNRWLCVTRLRASAACAVFVFVLRYLSPHTVHAGGVFGVCIALAVVSTFGLRASAGNGHGSGSGQASPT
jgi:hypothetical protein